MFYPSLFDFHPPQRTVYIVSEERLKALEAKQKQEELDSLVSRIEAYRAQSERTIELAEVQVKELQAELAALPAAKEQKKVEAAV